MARKRTRKHTAAGFVLDCSVTMAWYFEDEANAYSKGVRKSLARKEAMVPALWPLEVANILLMGERRERSTAAEATKWLSYLQQLPIQVDEETLVRAWAEILSVARSYAPSAYDAAYLEFGASPGLAARQSRRLAQGCGSRGRSRRVQAVSVMAASARGDGASDYASPKGEPVAELLRGDVVCEQIIPREP